MTASWKGGVMVRIPEEELQRIKKEIDLAALVRSRGLELKVHGHDFIGLCPFHEDRNPSLVVTPSKNLWHCLGACQAGGSVIDWVMKAEGVSFCHAVELLRDGKASRIITSKNTTKKSTVRKLPSPVELSADDQKLLRQVIDYYHETLKKTPAALQYLQKRGINNEESLTQFKLGFADRTLGLRLPDKQRREGCRIRNRLIELGIYRESGHEHFNGSIVIPVINGQGNIAEIYGRKIRDNLRAGTQYHTYLPGPHRGIWNPSSLVATKKEIILCESLIDALTFWTNGFRNVTASYGIEGFTEEHLKAFIENGIQKVYIAYDRDEAGDRAAEKLSKKLQSEGMECLRVQFPKGMDANAYACRMEPAPQALQLLLNASVWMGRGKPPEQEKPLVIKEENKTNIPTQIKGEDIEITLGDRSYRIRGLFKNLSYDLLKINLRVMKETRYHIDTFDLYNAKHRGKFVHEASVEIAEKEDIIKRDLGRVLLRLEELQEENINKTLDPKKKEIRIDDTERETALTFLKNPNLLDRILKDFEKCGIIGEETNKLVGYLAAVSRKLEEPLAVIIQSSSAAGKSLLMESILAFIPEEERVKYSAMTGQSLFYMGESDLKHKILAIVEEKGAEQASYALKLLQSEGELTIASTGKDPASGKHITHEYKVEGPVMIFLTTTAIEIDEELLNRCLVLTVNEDREQTKAIHRLQREKQTLEGLLNRKDRSDIVKLHQNAQRLLVPLLVANPFASSLTFLDDRTRTRRDHVKYLTLIRSIALLHQYQRSIKTITHQGKPVRYIEVILKDIEVANRLAHEVLGRSLDELPPQTRRLLDFITEMVRGACEKRAVFQEDFRFSRREVREYTGWNNTQLKHHLRRLEELEYLLVHSGARGQSFVYELLYKGEGKNGKPFLMKLIDVESLQNCNHDLKKSGVKEEKSGSSRGQVAPKSGGCRVEKNGAEVETKGISEESCQKPSKTHINGENKKIASYIHQGVI